MKIFHKIVLISIIGFILFSCRDDFHFEPSSGSDLAFSKDTVYLDTIFTNIGSSTYNLKVYNKSNKDIKIPSIRLAKGESSSFRLMVDGMPGKSFENVELLKNDSLFIFVETTVDIKQQTQGKEFLYTDEILFESGSKQQKVDLVTLVRDAIFLYPQKFQDGSYESLQFGEDKVYGFFLDENDAVNGNELKWNNEKPYVIYGYAAVAPNKTLNISEGTEVYFHRNSGLVAFSHAAIHAKGTIEKPIIFQGDRLEPSFEDTPGQWDRIWLSVDSNGSFENVMIKNATFGLLINKNENPVNIQNLQVYNCVENGLYLVAANVIGKNIVTNNCGNAALRVDFGGTYDFTHCTFANYWNRQNHTAVRMDNGDGTNEFALKAHFKNSIIYGNSNESLFLFPAKGTTNFDFKFDNCLIKFFNSGNRFTTDFPYSFTNSVNYNNCLIAKNSIENQPYFLNTYKNQLMITDKATSIIGFGNPIFAQSIPSDITGKSRTNSADLGAYQHVSSTQD